MTRGGRLLVVLVVLLLIGGIRFGQELYRYYAYAEERNAITRLEREVEESGFSVIETQLRAESLRQQIERTDERLNNARQELERLEQQLLRGNVVAVIERAYRDDLATYNETVSQRNSLYREWREAVDSNHLHVARYNLLADSIRLHANAMGEPYYPVASPAEIAVRRESPRGP